MFDYTIKIGLLPMRRDLNDRPKGTFLSWWSAEERCARFVNYIEKNFASDKISFVDTKGLGNKDLIYDAKSGEEAVMRFREAKVDAVFLINCNFGNEEAAADIIKALDKPCLLWSPLDD